MDSITYDVIRSRTTYRRSTDPLRDYQRPRSDGSPHDHEDRGTDSNTSPGSTIHPDPDTDAIVQIRPSDDERGGDAMSDFWSLPRIWRKDAPKPKPRHQQVKCTHRNAVIIDPFGGWKYCCLECGIKAR